MVGEHSPALKPHWLAPVAFLLGFVVLYFAAMPLMEDPDIPWHLASGRLILDTHALPATDPWSFASNGAPWYLLSWLWDVVLSGVEQATGTFGVFLFAMLLFGALLAGLARHLQSFAVDTQAVMLTLMLVTLCMVEFASARPQLAGYLMIVAFCHLLHQSRGQNDYGRLWFLPPLMLVWANCHGSFLAGFTLLGAYGLEAIIRKERAWLRRLLAVSFACLAAALINPYGAGIITGAMQSIDSDLRDYIIEWQPFAFGKSIGLSVWVLVFVMASNLRNREIPLANKILAFAWFFGTLLVLRNAAIFVLVSAPYLASCLDVQTRGLRDKTSPTPLALWFGRQSLQKLWGLSLAGAALFAVLSTQWPHHGRVYCDDREIDDAIAYIRKNEQNRRYLSDFDFGGKLIYAGADIPFFMDSRSNTAYGSEEMRNYLAFWLLKPGWEQKLEPYNINGILVHKDSRFAKAYAGGQFQDRWHLVFAGKLANVYIAAP